MKQYFRRLLKKFVNSPYLGHNSKYFQNKPTDTYFFLVKQITKIIKSKKYVQLSTKGFKSGVNKTIGHVNESIQYGELESINITAEWMDKYIYT